MTTSLASQLKQLAFAQQGVAGATRSHQHASLLYSEKDAQAFTLTEVCEMGTDGYTRLCAVDMASFQPFAPLFGTASMDVKRSMQTKDQNKVLDQQIARFLRVLSPHMLLPAAHKCFEWLLRRYQVHMYNVDSIMEAILPYHGTALFTRIILLLVLNDDHKKWHFLETARKTRVPLDRLSLIRQCIGNQQLLAFVCKMVFAACENKPVPPSKLDHVTALYASIACGVLTTSPKQDVLATALPFLLRGLKHDHADVVGANLIITTQLATAATLSDAALSAISEALCHFQGTEADTQRLQVLSLLCRTQRLKRLPEATLALLLKRETLVDDLLSLARSYNIDTLAQALVASLCKGSSKRIDKLMDILPALESCCGHTLDAVLQQHVSGRRDSKALVDALRKRRIFGVRFAEVSEHDINVFMGLQHEDTSVRVASVNKIFESLKGTESISDRDKEFLTSNLFARLTDDDDDIVRTAILQQLYLLLPHVSVDACVKACTDTLVIACEEGRDDLAHAAARALCRDAVDHALKAEDSDLQKTLTFVALNRLLPAVVFRKHRVDTSIGVARAVWRSNIDHLVPSLSHIKPRVKDIRRARAENQNSLSIAAMNTTLLQDLATQKRSARIFVDTPSSSHAAMFVRLRVLSLGLTGLNEKSKPFVIGFLLDALTTYMLSAQGITADDVRRVMLRAGVGATDPVCDAVLPLLMQGLPPSAHEWTANQRALVAVFVAACLADVAAACRLHEPPAPAEAVEEEAEGDEETTKKSKKNKKRKSKKGARGAASFSSRALLCAASCPVPRLAQPALSHILPAASSDSIRLLSSVAFAGTATPLAQAACLCLICNVIDSRAAAHQAVPAALLACSSNDDGVRRAAVSALKAARKHLASSAAAEAPSASAAAAAGASLQEETAGVISQLLQSRDDIVNDAANLKQTLATVLQSRGGPRPGSKRAKHSAHRFETFLDNLLTWAEETSFGALAAAADILEECDTPARARVVLKHLLPLLVAALPEIGNRMEDIQGTIANAQHARRQRRAKAAAKKGSGGSDEGEITSGAAGGAGGPVAAAGAAAVDDETAPHTAVRAVVRFAAMLTPTAVRTVEADASLRPELRAVFEALLQAEDRGALRRRRRNRKRRKALHGVPANSPLLLTLAADGTSGHEVASLGLLKAETFAALHKDMQAAVTRQLLELAFTGVESQDTIRDTLSQLPLHADLVEDFLRASFQRSDTAAAGGAGDGDGAAMEAENDQGGDDGDDPGTLRNKRSKGSAGKKENGEDEGDKSMATLSEEAVVAGFAEIACILEVLELRDLSTVAEVESLLPVLNSILQSYRSLGDAHQATCHATVHTLLGVMTRILKRIPAAASSPASSSSSSSLAAEVDVDLVVQVLSESRKADLQTQALLLLGELARLVPRQVIPCCMPLFAFLRQPFFQPDDDYTLQVLQRTIEAVVPAIKRAASSKRNEVTLLLDLCGVFVDSFYTFPHHRRRGLFVHLVQTLGGPEFLPVVVLLMMKKEVLDPRGFEDDLSNQYVAASSRVQRARGTGSQIPSFVLSLCKALPLEEHLLAVFTIMRALLVLPVVSGSDVARLSHAKPPQQVLAAARQAAANAAENPKQGGSGKEKGEPELVQCWSLEQLQWLVTRLASGKGMQAKHTRHWRYLLINQVLRHVASRGVLRQLAALEQYRERSTGKDQMEEEEEEEEEDGGEEEAQAPAARRARVHKLNLRIAELALELGALYRTQAREAAMVNEEAANQLAKEKQRARSRGAGAKVAKLTGNKHPAGTNEYWRRVRSDAGKVIQNAYAVLTLEDFVKVCMRLLASENMATQQQAVEMVATRVEAIARYNSAVTNRELNVVMRMVPVLAGIAQRSSAAVLASADEASDKSAPLPSDDRQLKLTQGAAHAIAVMAARYAAARPDVFVDHAKGVLSMIDISKGARTYAVAATCMASFAVLSSVLGMKLLPHFPPLIERVVGILGTATAIFEKDEVENKQSDEDDEEKEEEEEEDGEHEHEAARKAKLSSGVRSQALLLLQSCFDLATVCVQQFSNMFTSKVLQRLVAACVHPYMCTRRESPLPEALVGKAIALRALIAKRVAARHVVEAVPVCFRQVQAKYAHAHARVGELADSLRALLMTLEQTIAASSPEVVARQAANLFRFYATALQFRALRRGQQATDEGRGDGDESEDEESLEAAGSDVREAILLVEGSAISCVCATVLHMSDQAFRPYFMRLVDWATSGLMPLQADKAGDATARAGPCRVVTLARLVQELASRLRHVFVPYFSSLLRLYVRFLANEGRCLARLGPDGPDMVKYVCRGLGLCFANDRDGFISTERFSALAEALISQLNVQSYALEVTPTPAGAGEGEEDEDGVEEEEEKDESDGNDGDDGEESMGSVAETQEEYVQRVAEDVIPCIVDLADKGGEERQLRELNRLIVGKCHDEEPVVRLGAVKLLHALYERMGEELLALLSDTISVLSELLEDSDASVEREVHRLIKTVESHLSEPLSAYLQA